MPDTRQPLLRRNRGRSPPPELQQESATDQDHQGSGGGGKTNTSSKIAQNRRRSKRRSFSRKRDTRDRTRSATRLDGKVNKSLLLCEYSSGKVELTLIALERGKYDGEEAVHMLLHATMNTDIEDIKFCIHFEDKTSEDETSKIETSKNKTSKNKTSDYSPLRVLAYNPRQSLGQDVSVKHTDNRTRRFGWQVGHNKTTASGGVDNMSGREFQKKDHYRLQITYIDSCLTAHLEKIGKESTPPSEFNFQVVVAYNDTVKELGVIADVEIKRSPLPVKADGKRMLLDVDNAPRKGQDYSHLKSKDWKKKNGTDTFETL